MSTKVPLLNEYKKEFFYKRLPETFFGGLKLKFGYDVPFYVYFFQVWLWLLPAVIAGVMVLLTELAGLNVLYSCIIAGGVVFLKVLALQVCLASLHTMTNLNSAKFFMSTFSLTFLI